MFVDDPITEDRWLSSRSLDRASWMIRRIWTDQMISSTRKSHLFACACARHIWKHLSRKRSRRGVEYAERYIEGEVTRAKAKKAARVVRQVLDDVIPDSDSYWDNTVATIASHPSENRFNDWKIPNAMRYLDLSNSEIPAALVRDIFGNPFRIGRVHSSWLADPLVLGLANTIYQQKAFDQLPILGQVLEACGCDDLEILNHCSSPGPHVRGCWVADMLLEKK